jgi:hypothetical protein
MKTCPSYVFSRRFVFSVWVYLFRFRIFSVIITALCLAEVRNLLPYDPLYVNGEWSYLSTPLDSELGCLVFYYFTTFTKKWSNEKECPEN